MVPRFDVFSGLAGGKNAVWMDCAESFEKARNKMQVLAVENPGHYFVFSAAQQRIVADVDTTDGVQNDSRATNDLAKKLLRSANGWIEETAADNSLVFSSGDATLRISPDGHWRCTVTRDLRKTAVQGPIEELERFLKEFAELNPHAQRQSA
jgi:hypothetical protein